MGNPGGCDGDVGANGQGLWVAIVGVLYCCAVIIGSVGDVHGFRMAVLVGDSGGSVCNVLSLDGVTMTIEKYGIGAIHRIDVVASGRKSHGVIERGREGVVCTSRGVVAGGHVLRS